MKDCLISIFEQLDFPNALLGGVIGYFLVFVVNRIRSPKIKNISFVKEKVNFGTLYKIKFKVCGNIHPGASEIIISWDGGSVRAKWDETPNPLRGDQLEEFVPEKVPDTRTLNVHARSQEYKVPIIHENEDGVLTIFSGWWFGKDYGYGADVPTLEKNQKIQVEFISQNLHKKLGSFALEDIILVE